MTATALGTALATGAAGITSSVFGWQFGFGESSIIGLFAFFLLRSVNEIQRTPFKDPFISPILKVMRNGSALTLLFLALCDGAAILGGFAEGDIVVVCFGIHTGDGSAHRGRP